MTVGGVVTVICTYRVRPGGEAEFEQLLAAHQPALRRLGLLADTPARVLRSVDGGGPAYVEIFEWIDEEAAARAAEIPEVVDVWEPMAALCESRDGRPAMEFPHFRDIA